MQNIQDEVRTFVIDNFLFGQADSAFGDTDSFLDNGVIDSTGVLELVAFVEQRYQIAVADDELMPSNLDSVARVAAFIERKRQAKEIGLAS